jgi:hypothetical protein
MLYQPRDPRAYIVFTNYSDSLDGNYFDTCIYNRLCIELNIKVFHLDYSSTVAIGARRAVQGWSIEKICRVYGLRRNPQYNLPKVKHTAAHDQYKADYAQMRRYISMSADLDVYDAAYLDRDSYELTRDALDMYSGYQGTKTRKAIHFCAVQSYHNLHYSHDLLEEKVINMIPLPCGKLYYELHNNA